MLTIYQDPGADITGIWVIEADGRMKYLHVPIRLLCINHTGDFIAGITYYAEAVVGGRGGLILYIIFNKPVRHSNFRIVEKR